MMDNGFTKAYVAHAGLVWQQQLRVSNSASGAATAI